MHYHNCLYIFTLSCYNILVSLIGDERAGIKMFTIIDATLFYVVALYILFKIKFILRVLPFTLLFGPKFSLSYLSGGEHILVTGIGIVLLLTSV